MRALMTTGSRLRHRPTALCLAFVLILAAPALAWGSPSQTPATVHGGSEVAASELSGHASPPIPFLPVTVRPIGVDVPAVVNPRGIYHSEPAPMGIGDFGVGAGGHPYTYSTSQFIGNFSWQSLNLKNGSDHQFSDQLNVVLQFKQGGVTYAYWIQDVAFMDSSTGALQFENNIWNFTTVGFCLSSSAVNGNGSVYPLSGCEGYYAVGASSQPGAFEDMPSPGDFSLLVRSYLSGGGAPEVAFEYWDGVTSYEVTYDNVVWPWATSVTTDNNFLVNGNATAPSGNFYDAELTLGGPGNGAATSAVSATNATSRLLYWNGHNFEATRAVWNFGSDTAEAISTVQSIFSHDSGGTPLTTQLNGTTRNATPALSYDQGRVGVLIITVPGISSGTVSVAGTDWNFLTGEAALTLVPGVYHIWVNSSSQHHDLGNCEITGGLTTSVAVPGTCFPSVSTPTGIPPGADVGQPVMFRTTLTGAGSGGDTYNWSSLPAGLGCTGSTSNSISCRPISPGNYTVAVSVTDSTGQTNSSGPLEFHVDSDPAIAQPGATPSTVETGAAVSFLASAMGGSGGYTFAWTGLPTPCAGITTSTPVCHPSTADTYAVSVNIADSNGFPASSVTLYYAVVTGPAVTGPLATPASPLDLGHSVNFSAMVIGGVGPYTYAWLGLPPGCPSVNGTSVVCTPLAAGTSSVTLSVTDSAGGKASSRPLPFIVDGGVQLGPVSISPPGVDLGQGAAVTILDVSGGDGAYSYVWSGLPTGCAGTNASSIVCQPTVTGTFSLSVTVTDSEGSQATSGAALTVSSDPSIEGIVASAASVDVGQRVNYSAVGVSGGTGGNSYAWSQLPTGCLSENTAVLSCTPTSPGRFPLNVSVTDTNHKSADYSITYIVDPVPTVTVPTSSPRTDLVGNSAHLTTATTPGSGNLQYSWSGLPPGCGSTNGPNLTCTPTTGGTYFVVVTVRDSNGGSATSMPLSFGVIASFLGLPMAEGYLLITAIVVGAVAVTIAVAWSRGRRIRTPPTGMS
jgi:hypothetical protein